MEREPGDPGIPYDPDDPERLVGRSASGASPSTPAPYGGPSVPRPSGRRPAHWRGWVGGGLAVAGVVALMSLASTGDNSGDDTGSSASVIALPANVTTVRIQTTSDDVTLDRPSGTTPREVTVDNGSARYAVEGSVLVLRPEDDADVALPPGVQVEVRTTSGDVQGDDLQAEGASVQTTSGDVSLGWSSAPTSVDVRTTSGQVDVDLPRGDYDVTVTSNSGDKDVDRTVPVATNTVQVRTESGDITVQD